jgi:hypothetical protein
LLAPATAGDVTCHHRQQWLSVVLQIPAVRLADEFEEDLLGDVFGQTGHRR